MRHETKNTPAVLARVALVIVAGLCSCRAETSRDASGVMQTEVSPMPTRPIEEVLADRTEELMALDGVSGVYQSALEDGTPCIKVITSSATPAGSVPKRLEGHPVVVVESGPLEAK